MTPSTKGGLTWDGMEGVSKEQEGEGGVSREAKKDGMGWIWTRDRLVAAADGVEGPERSDGAKRGIDVSKCRAEMTVLQEWDPAVRRGMQQ